MKDIVVSFLKLFVNIVEVNLNETAFQQLLIAVFKLANILDIFYIPLLNIMSNKIKDFLININVTFNLYNNYVKIDNYFYFNNIPEWYTVNNMNYVDSVLPQTEINNLQRIMYSGIFQESWDVLLEELIFKRKGFQIKEYLHLEVMEFSSRLFEKAEENTIKKTLELFFITDIEKYDIEETNKYYKNISILMYKIYLNLKSISKDGLMYKGNYSELINFIVDLDLKINHELAYLVLFIFHNLLELFPKTSLFEISKVIKVTK